MTWGRGCCGGIVGRWGVNESWGLGTRRWWWRHDRRPRLLRGIVVLRMTARRLFDIYTYGIVRGADTDW